jgi:hypothetical protein
VTRAARPPPSPPIIQHSRVPENCRARRHGTACAQANQLPEAPCCG